MSFASAAWAAAPGEEPQFGPLLFGLAVMVGAARAAGLLAERWKQPSVLAELLVGIGLGNLLPVFLGEAGLTFRSDPALMFLAEVGVLILLFDVGLEADVRALARVGVSSLLVASIGLVVPIILGWGAATWLLPDSPPLTRLFVGTTLSATSVGITARVLRDLGATHSREGRIIIGAAIADDILGLVLLAVVAGMVTAAAGDGPSLSALAILGILVRAVLFLAVTVGLGIFLSEPIARLAGRSGDPDIVLVFGLSLCFALAFVAELLGMAGIIGAFAAGLMLDPYGKGVRTGKANDTLAERLRPLSSLFVPLFFVLMGTHVHLGSLMDLAVLGFGTVLILGAIAGKLACSLGVLERGVNRLAIGVGMIPRGEVGLVFAGIGTGLTLEGRPLLSQSVFSAVVLMVLVTTLVAPMALRWVLDRSSEQGGVR
ncbi:MAG: hypothetical protein A2Z31_07525 [candidate division NC10 bacterium RBG_16_65_8]|nr:MAG: hypothetical protein A2Z31_07525 [candidate division NC10 bacterium RBG_16_65_8]